ncbi:MAG: histidine phosphatase family protein, partial [Candidatus Colwellbacteria bacterium]|nr:histidine phosphatase family protein [Candidatus Colwellbacteria bacterium]
MELWIFRHPVSVWNIQHIHQGQSYDDPGLAPEGLLQAKKIAEYLSGFPLLGIWSSPLPRTMQCAKIIQRNQAESVSIYQDNDLIEVSNGALDGMTFKEIKEKYPEVWERWEKKELDKPLFHGGESAYDVSMRGVRAFARAASHAFFLSCEHKRIGFSVIISHGATIAYSLARIANIPIEQAFERFEQDNGARNALFWNNNVFEIVRTNDTSHLGDTV